MVDVAASVLVAPQRYVDSIGSMVEKFDAFVTYEEINTWLGRDPLLLKAIQHCETGYIAERGSLRGHPHFCPPLSVHSLAVIM